MVRKMKHTEIGDIPVDWELQTFEETFRVLSNNTLSRDNLNNRGGAVRNIHYGDILTKFPEVLDCREEDIPYINDLSLLTSSTQLLQDGDIVVADTAEDETVGKITEVQNLGDSKLVAGLHTIPCRVKKGDFAPGWLGYYMNSDLFHNQILPYITGIKVSSISKGAISETLILIPPFDEQEKIVQSLNEVQLLMTVETKVVNKIKFVKNGCLSKMFPQKDDTVPEMRLPGFTDAWEQRKLSDVADVRDGTHASPKYIGEGHPLVTSKNVKDGFVNYDDIQCISDEDFDEINKRSKVDVNDVLMGMIGTIGNIALIRNEPDFAIKNVALIKDTKQINYLYLYHFLQSNNTTKQLTNSMDGGTQKFIALGNIRNLDVDIPSDEEQERLGQYFENLDHLITLHQRKCDKYSNIKKGMMSDLLKGKIRLV